MIKLKQLLLEVEINDIINTNNFKKWFGKSVVVDEHGNPRIVYHGSNSDKFTKFSKDFFQKNEPHQTGEGFYFGKSANYVGGYAYDRSDHAHRPDRVGAYFLKIENPAPKDIIDAWRNNIHQIGCEVRTLPREQVKEKLREAATKMRKFLQSKGYDGYAAVGNFTNNVAELVVFEPTQIKSAFNNNGEFNPNDPDTTK